MKHPNAMVNAFLHLPESRWKNELRYVLAFHPWVPRWISDWSPVKGYEAKRKLRPGDIVVDAGAYPGDYAIYAARKVGPTGRVICFEPGEANRRVLERNLAREGFTHVAVVPKGLWHEETVLRYRADGLASTALDAEGGEEIPVTTLDAELERLGIPEIQVLKMDIEGAEIEAVQGARRTLARSRAHVCIASYHVVNGETTSRFLEDFLRGIGYHAETGYPRHLTTYAWREEAAKSP